MFAYGNLILLIYGMFNDGGTSPVPPTFFRITDDVVPNFRITDSGDRRITD